MTQLKGIFAAMCTPLDDSGSSIDDGRYKAHIDDIIGAGVHGLVLGSGTGEYAYLSDAEQRHLIEIGAKHTKGRVPVIAQTTALATKDVIEKSKAAQDAGATAVMVMPPFLEPPGERGVIWHYEAIAKAISIPVVMYNVPQQAAPLTEDMYRRLIAVENLDYVKDSSGDFLAVQKFCQIGGGVFCGIDSLIPWALMEGCVGSIWGAANFMPHECAQLYDLIAAGEHKAALALWDQMRTICLWFGGNRHDVDYLTGIKAAARLTGRDMGPPRRPLPPLTAAARHDLRIALSKLPVNRSRQDRLIWRDWQEERDWLIQSTKTGGAV